MSVCVWTNVAFINCEWASICACVYVYERENIYESNLLPQLRLSAFRCKHRIAVVAATAFGWNTEIFGFIWSSLFFLPKTRKKCIKIVIKFASSVWIVYLLAYPIFIIVISKLPCVVLTPGTSRFKIRLPRKLPTKSYSQFELKTPSIGYRSMRSLVASQKKRKISGCFINCLIHFSDQLSWIHEIWILLAPLSSSLSWL